MPDSLFQRYKTASIAHMDLVTKHYELSERLAPDEAHNALVDASASRVAAAAAALNEARAAYLTNPT
jgi:hypothetical protein